MSQIRNLDRITEAYSGAMGKEFGKKTRNRINWIVNQVYGNKILDIGCSQGIIPIILGREGKKTDAIDIAEESIQYALNQLESEHQTVRENVTFRVSNFSTDNTLHSDYETILLTEVLEHIADPSSFLKKINSHLMIGGNLVVTVPFGINDYFDHKRTYYFLDLYDQLSAYFEIDKIEYLGNWVGVVCKKSESLKVSDKKENFSRNILEQLEIAFYKLERGLVTRITDFQANIQDKNRHIKNLEIQHQGQMKELKERLNREDTGIIDELKKQNEHLFSSIHHLNEHSKLNAMKIDEYVQKKETKIIELEEKIDLYQNTILMHLFDIEKKDSEIKRLTLSNRELENEKERFEQKLEKALMENKNLLDLKAEITKLNEENEKQNVTTVSLESYVRSLEEKLNASLENEEKALKYILKIKDDVNEYENQMEKLEKKNVLLEKRYLALKNSKLGKWTLKYWDAKRKLRR